MGASRELTPKQEKFCQAYIQTGMATEAYRQAYDTSGYSKQEYIHVEASKLLNRNPKITQRVEELKARQMQRHDVTLDSLTLELEEIRNSAMSAEKYSAAVSAVMGKARIHGLDVQQVKVTVKRETTPQERLAMLQGLLSRAAFPTIENPPQEELE